MMITANLLENLFSPMSIFGLLIGVTLGLVIGALPGLGGTMGIALMIPMTYSMSPGPALIMLTALYTAAVYGGSITAILLHTPGTPASAATALDGYELTKRGEGLRAVGISTVASCVGGIIGGVLLLLIAPQLAKVSVMVNGPEYFLLALFGLTIIGSLSSGNLLKGILAGVFGLCCALVGQDIINGLPRFHFGITGLQSGISTVPALIGLFSFTQVMTTAEELAKGRGTKSNLELAEIKGRILPTFQEFKSLLPNMLRSSCIGTLIGVLPGAGADIGSWVSYNEAKRWAKNKDEFGRGAIGGICASEAANNAVCGGALIPMMTLGIPGSSAAAVLMGGMMIHGLVPGNSLFSTYADTTYSILLGYILANVVMAVIGLLICKKLVNIVRIPNSVLTTVVVVLSVIGAYAINNSYVDVVVMIVFGILGYFMRKFDFPAAPVVLALILGSMAEQGFMRALIMKQDLTVVQYYFGRPVCIILMCLIVVSLFSPLFMNVFSNRMRQDADVDVDLDND